MRSIGVYGCDHSGKSIIFSHLIGFSEIWAKDDDASIENRNERTLHAGKYSSIENSQLNLKLVSY